MHKYSAARIPVWFDLSFRDVITWQSYFSTSAGRFDFFIAYPPGRVQRRRR
jgi:hypothetical protein